jgi:hypothetical protein
MVQTLLGGIAISLILSLFVVAWIMWRLEFFAKQTDE